TTSTSTASTASQSSQSSQSAGFSIQQKDAFKYVSVSVNRPVYELLQLEIRSLLVDRLLDYEIEEDPSWCVTWKCRPQLADLVRQVAAADNNLFQCGSILPDFRFDHLMIVLKCDQLHRYVSHFMDTLDEDEE